MEGWQDRCNVLDVGGSMAGPTTALAGLSASMQCYVQRRTVNAKSAQDPASVSCVDGCWVGAGEEYGEDSVCWMG